MKRGFGIAETLIASAIIASLIMAFMGVTTVISHSAQLAYQQSVAANLAQRRIEQLRFTVERAWSNSRNIATLATPLADGEWAQGVVSDVAPLTTTESGIVYSVRVTVDKSLNLLPPIYAKNETGTYVTATASDPELLYRKIHVDVTWSDGGSPRSYSLETVVTNWREGVL